ncbi:hypothetical protein TYRP_000173 [Tyrophagus putrescentiae]|nr:hypothetical protein TYRP_000173 [Tyrophagus putrescentiae]
MQSTATPIISIISIISITTFITPTTLPPLLIIAISFIIFGSDNSIAQPSSQTAPVTDWLSPRGKLHHQPRRHHHLFLHLLHF